MLSDDRLVELLLHAQELGRLLPQALDVECASRAEVLDAPHELGFAAEAVRAEGERSVLH